MCQPTAPHDKMPSCLALSPQLHKKNCVVPRLKPTAVGKIVDHQSLGYITKYLRAPVFGPSLKWNLVYALVQRGEKRKSREVGLKWKKLARSTVHRATSLVFTVSLRMKECIIMSEVWMKLASLLAEPGHVTTLSQLVFEFYSYFRHSYAFFHS